MISQRKSKPKAKPGTFLYARIMLWVTIPLFVLSAFFGAIQLSQQLQALNQINQVKSEIAFKSIFKALQPEFKKPENLETPKNLLNFLKQLQKSYGVGEIDCFNLLENKPLFGSRRGGWSRADTLAIEEILPQHKETTSYVLRVDKNSKQLIAYMFFQGREPQELYIGRVPFPLTDIATALRASRWTLSVMLFLIIFIGFIISQGIARSILRPIKMLDQATQEIMRGQLGRHVEIETGDEIEGLANTFNKMSDALEEMKRQAQDANPLTGIPGNTGIFHNLEKRINERQKFVMFHCDLDRFKVFNDQFGLAQGDKAIKATADMLKKAVKEKGGPDDFIGHQGGDDFVLITRPQRAAELADYVCEAFKSVVVSQLYPREDFKNGYTLQLDRRRQNETGETVMVPFPLISITLAGISNVRHDFADYADCMARVAPVKKEAKKIAESNFVIKE